MMVPKMKHIYIVIFAIFLYFEALKCELFTALVELEKVLHTENAIAKDINEYIKEEELRLEQLKKVAKDYENHSQQGLKNSEKFLANPVNAYLLVKRFTIDWADILAKYLKSNAGQDIINRMLSRQDIFPGTEDLNGAINALLRLQDTYQIPASKIQSGDLPGTSDNKTKSPQLTAEECFELGNFAYNRQDYYHTMMWMEEALHLNEQGDNTKRKEDIIDYLSFAAAQQGNHRYALKLTNDLLELDPSHERAMNNKKYYEHKLAGTPDQDVPILNPKPADDYKQGEEFDLYERLCRNEVVRPDPNAHKLKCHYRDLGNNWLKIGPVKEETMFLKPWIAIYYDVVTDREIEKIKSLAAPNLNRATVQNAVTGELEFAEYRVSKSAWLKDEHDEVCRVINRRIEAITGLNVDTAEELQVVNYGIGGHYEPHFDFARKEETNAFKSLGTGNRIATWLTYLSDVEAGGGTVFPYIGAKLWPKKGAAAFWYNLHRNGEGDYLTRHAACPVLTGSKWVCNKWIHERGQEFRRPCSLDPEE